MILCSHANRIEIGESARRNLPQRSWTGTRSRHRTGKQRHLQFELSSWPIEFAGKFRFFRSPVARHSSEVAGTRCRTVQGMGGNTWTSIRNSWKSEEHTSELQSLRHLVCRL